MKRVLMFLLAGACAGFLVWLIAEPNPWLRPSDMAGMDVNYTAESMLGALLGLGIGAALGASEGWLRGSSRQAWIYALGGGAAGLLGGFLGIRIGQAVYGPWEAFNQKLAASNTANPLNPVLQPIAFASKLAARTVGWSLIGLFVGISMGALRYSPRRMRSSLSGGLVGGALGGFCFQLVAILVGVPALSRAIGFACVGGGTGFGISVAQQIARQAWMRVVAGRNEGRDYLLEKEINTIGRDEMSDVPLFGDPSIGKAHAYVKRVSGIWYLQDAGNSTGTQVNGQPVRERPLQDGDRITIGRFTLEFHHRGRAAAPLPQDRDVAPVALAPQPAQAGVCAFCGSARNPLTGACACTPVAGTAPAPAGGIPAFTLGATLGASAAPGGFLLLATAGPYSGQQFVVSGRASIGRQEGNTVALAADGAVSRRHATLAAGPAGLKIHDEGSSNGTFVNGARVVDATLRPGDEIRIGETHLRVAAS